jgi:hypothetical protein
MFMTVCGQMLKHVRLGSTKVARFLWMTFSFPAPVHFPSKFLELFQARAVLWTFVLRPEVEKMTLAALNRLAWASSGMKMLGFLWSTIRLSSTEKKGF